MTDLKDNTNLAGTHFTITMQGLSYWSFATCTLDLTAQTLSFTEKKGSPHVYFSDTYAFIQLEKPTDDGHEIIFSRDMIGTINYPATEVNVALVPGSILYISHAEATSRLKLHNDTTDTDVAITSTDSAWLITEEGLQVTDIPHSPYPVANIRGNIFDWNIFGANENAVMDINLDVMLAQLKIDFFAGQAQAGNPDECITLYLKDEFGNQVYSRVITGDEVLQSGTLEFDFYEGYELSISNVWWENSQLVNSETNQRMAITTDNNVVANVDKGLFSVTIPGI